MEARCRTRTGVPQHACQKRYKHTFLWRQKRHATAARRLPGPADLGTAVEAELIAPGPYQRWKGPGFEGHHNTAPLEGMTTERWR